ncbi:DUF938 domain-containing protein [Roseovarius faecimaris]|uniref:DUF938 domain-containing protein n=1 Tax=Roseovarius faecimaris TaxID=2494550 RepID=A0A6I6ISN5_9RHOB|nr:DUF938 domain-containing protein [Roseovarius faecimaris]QGX99725.1 DUF938 domain-containing protein [Roseovarius faecimaris]
MKPPRPLPRTASVAEPVQGAMLSAPAAERNAAAILDVIHEFAPSDGRALELASGTGQHVVAFARALPGLTWQPSEPDPARRASIDAWAEQAGLPNLRQAIALDACAPGWGMVHAGQKLILLVNLLHLISTPEAKTLLREAATALAPGGRLMLYGPFLRDGQTTSDGDARFHANLRASDPAIGYKDDADMTRWLKDKGLHLLSIRPMPANNLFFIVEKPI